MGIKNVDVVEWERRRKLEASKGRTCKVVWWSFVSLFVFSFLFVCCLFFWRSRRFVCLSVCYLEMDERRLGKRMRMLRQLLTDRSDLCAGPWKPLCFRLPFFQLYQLPTEKLTAIFLFNLGKYYRQLGLFFWVIFNHRYMIEIGQDTMVINFHYR